MKITVIGTGYVGLVSGTCFAEVGYDVMCIDIDTVKIKNLQNGIIPIYEPGLEELVQRNIEEGRLHFSSHVEEGMKFGDIIFSAVGTPPDKDHRADLQYVKAVAKSFGELLQEGEEKIFVNKSTVPVGTADVCKKIIQEELKKRKVEASFHVCSNPEFLREGCAIADTMTPDRIVVGTDSDYVRSVMENLYEPFVRVQSPLVFVEVKSAEIIKYASNAFLATKISFINEIANFTEISGGNIKDIAKGMGLDERIGSRFLQAGIGYGGSCFPKDVQALIQTGKEHDYNFQILCAVESVNASQKEKIFIRLKQQFADLHGKTISLLGLSFKPNTDDIRDAPSLRLLSLLLEAGAKVQAFDPIAMENTQKQFPESENLVYVKNPLEAVTNADAVLLVTEWDEFRGIEPDEMKSLMRGNVIIDGRNIWHPEEMKKAGFIYSSIGRKNI